MGVTQEQFDSALASYKIKKMSEDCKVVIIGGGVSGTSLAYTLTKRGIKVLLIEKNFHLAKENSAFSNNSQTLHIGEIETNYSLEKALSVKEATSSLVDYLENHCTEGIHYRKVQKMVLATTSEEVIELTDRFDKFKDHYPTMKLVEGTDLYKLEPSVVIGRKFNHPIALVNSGYSVNFEYLSNKFIEDSLATGLLDLVTGDPVVKVQPFSGIGHLVYTKNGEIYPADFVVYACGSYSLLAAKELGYGLNLSMLPIGGSFYYANIFNLLNGKVYTVQKKKLPFAAIHGDPEVGHPKVIRFGPTAFLSLKLSKSGTSISNYISAVLPNFKAFRALLGVVFDPILMKYMAKNILYKLPFIGKKLFLKEAQKVVPTLKLSDLTTSYNAGIRPQIIDINTGELLMGDASIHGENIIFNITPSPGASVCLSNAKRDADYIVKELSK